jgi:predicted hotdog family 3-hydroxylacyl-ACP dehydratase
MSTIEHYLAHRGPARWIDRLVELDAEHAVVESDVPLHGRLVRDGTMPAWAGIELMAQAVAAWGGGCAEREGRPVRIGFLLGSRRYQSHCDGFASGTTLRIAARREFVSDEGLGMFDCRIHCGDALLAQAQVAVFEPSDATPYASEPVASAGAVGD